jgi:hypothetical protein
MSGCQGKLSSMSAQNATVPIGIKQRGKTPHAKHDSYINDAIVSGDIIVDGESNIFRNMRTRIAKIKALSSGRGYKQICLCVRGKFARVLVHRVVWIAKNGMPSDEYMQINHIDGNRSNNFIDNLEMVTARQNQIHSVMLGTKKTGVFLLSKEEIEEIKKSYIWGSREYGLKKLGEKYGVGTSVIWRAIYGPVLTHRTKMQEYKKINGRRRDLRIVNAYLEEK